MELISSHQLHNYEEILDQINREHEKCEKLKLEIQRADDAIIALKLSLNPPQKGIGHVNVKIFPHFTEILNLYEENVNCDVEMLSKCQDCNFFLIEVVLTKCLLEKLVPARWKLHLNVHGDTFSENRIVPLFNKNSIFEIIPVSSEVRQCQVDTRLLLFCSDESPFIDLPSVDVDISYYFQASQSNKHVDSSKTLFLKLAKLYNKDTTDSLAPLQNQTKLIIDKNTLLVSLVKNAYHQLNLESFTELNNDNKNIAEFQFYIGDNKVSMLFNKSLNLLKVRGHSCDMLLLRKFFTKVSKFGNPHEFRRKLKGIVAKKHSLEEMDLEEVLLFHQQLRKLWL